MGSPPAWTQLGDRLSLTRFERGVVLLCAAMELDTRFADLCASVQGAELAHPTFALAMALFDASRHCTSIRKVKASVVFGIFT